MRLVTIDAAPEELGISTRELLHLVLQRRIPRPAKFFAWTADEFERVRAQCISLHDSPVASSKTHKI